MKKSIVRVTAAICTAALAVSSFGACSLGKMKEFNGDLRERYDYNLKEYLKEGKYKGCEVRVGSDEMSERELNASIMEYRVLYTATQTRWTSVGEGVPAEKGNIVDVVFQGYLDGEPLSDLVNAKKDGYSMSLGSDKLIEGVDEELIGMKIGDKKTIELTVPDPCFDYPYYAGKTITMDVEIKDIRSAALAEYDEEMAEYYGTDSTESFEAQLISEWKRHRSEDLEDYVKTKAIEQILESFEVKKYPEAELDEVIQALTESDKAAAEQADMEFEEYVKTEFGLSEDEYSSELEEYAKQLVFEEMVMYYIARKEQLALTNAEFDEKATELAQENDMNTPAEYVSYMASYGYTEYNVREQIWYDMVLDFVYENAVQKN